MKILVEYFKELEKLFDWYFHLTAIKRIQLNHLVILMVSVFLLYKNDEQHRKVNNTLSLRIDSINNSRSKEQKEYKKSLEFYTEKFSDLLEKFLKQKEEVEQIKERK